MQQRKYQPEDLLNFVHLTPFVAGWKSLGLSDDDLQALENMIMLGPKRHPVVSATGGLRKMRFAPPGKKVGKRGAVRIGYAFLEEYSTILLVIAYSKKEKEDLTPDEKKAIKKLLDRIEREFAEGLVR